jgi:uncharacterized protein YndB with AHSA1/START domain
MKHTLTVASVLTVWVCVAFAQAPPGGAAPQPGAATPGAPAAGAPQAGRGGGRGGGRAAIIPRILRFEAMPTSIRPGQSVVLTWATEAATPTIDNGVGEVPPRGNVKLTPQVTTTYTMTAGGLTRAVTVTVAGTRAAPAATAATTAARATARIDGKPDFSGMYGFTGMAGFGRRGRGAADAPAPPASPYANLPARPTLKPGVTNTATPNPSGPTSDCLPLPADTAFGVPYPFQIIQNKNYVVLINEYPGTFRIIPIDQPHRADAADDPTWMGDSVGRWDGDTFVIDTIGYNGRHAIGGIQEPGEHFHTIERLTRVNGKDIFYEIIFEDPDKATGQWRTTQTFVGDTRAGVNKVMEFVCENNRNYTPLFGPQGPPAPGQPGGGRGQ